MKARTPTAEQKAAGRKKPGRVSLRTSLPRVEILPSLVRVKDILVPIDFSEPSGKAVQYALAFAKEFDAKITFLYVVEPPVFNDFEANPLALDFERAQRSAREKMTALRLQQGGDARYIKEVKTAVGKPFQEIDRFASNLKMDLIVIATHGRTGLKHVLMGSTAEKVVRHAPCPVLVVRESEREMI